MSAVLRPMHSKKILLLLCKLGARGGRMVSFKTTQTIKEKRKKKKNN